MQIVQKPVVNFGKGRAGKPELIVLHIMAGTLPGTYAWFNNPASQVSSHYGVGPNGEVWQFVKDEDTAWANGRILNPTAKWVKAKGTQNPNSYTISIEHEGHDLSKQPEKEIAASAELVKHLATKWNIPLDRDHIIGHYEIYSSKPNCPATDKSIIDKIIKLAKGEPEPVEPGKSKVEPELKDALKYAHDIALGEYIDPQDQRLMAERLRALKDSEMTSREKLEAIRKIVLHS